MSESVANLVEIMREAVRRATLYTADISPGDFLDRQMTIDAVALNLLVIGECANRLPEAVKLRGAQPWSRMVALRHRIAHGYTSIDPMLLWKIVRENLPELARELDSLERR